MQFRGVSEYLEDLLARIDTPQLVTLDITFLHRRTIETTQLTELISSPSKFKAHNRGRVVLESNLAFWVVALQTLDGSLSLGISGKQPDWELPSLAEVCSSSLPHILAMEHLYLFGGYMQQLFGKVVIDFPDFLELLDPFVAVKSLYVSDEFTFHVAYALGSLVDERVMEVLPALQTLFLQHPDTRESGVQRSIGAFVTARQFAGHPIVVSRWENISDAYN